MDTTSAAAGAVLDRVGARLRRLRTERGVTLTELAEVTGISKSTLSRLETGQRRPTLELLLALSLAHQVPLDELVDAPDVGDPRLRLKAGRLKGRMVVPLSRQRDAVQAWKIVLPAGEAAPQPRAHEGRGWIYVLSGRMRLVVGREDWVLEPGDVADFDARSPHWFGSAGGEAAEVLSIFTRPGERMNVRSAPAPSP